ncbi:hypothetical protein P7C70_g7796, partial [Phenoliferia sp. Uapishka_3]
PPPSLRSTNPPNAPDRRNLRRLASEARERELKATLPEFQYTTWAQSSPRLVYSIDEAVIRTELAAMQGPIGFDIEWNPFPFPRLGKARSKPGQTALVQICDTRTILLVHLALMPALSPSLQAFVEDHQRIKIGVQVAGSYLPRLLFDPCRASFRVIIAPGDGRKLKTDFGYQTAGMLELNNVARTVDPTHWEHRTSYGLIGLQALCARYLLHYLPKDGGIRCGAWDARLSTAQQYYAANDVYSSLQLFLFLQSEAPGEVLESLASDNLSTASSWNQPPAPSEPVILIHNDTPIDLPPTRLPPREPSLCAASDATNVRKMSDRLAPRPARPTARQLEAYHLWHEDQMPPDEVSQRMSLSRPIKGLSVM